MAPTDVSVIQAAVAMIIRIEIVKITMIIRIKVSTKLELVLIVQQARVLAGVVVLVSTAVVCCDGCCACGRNGTETASVSALVGCWFRCFG